MFINFFYLLKKEGVPVSITEWMTLMDALSKGMAASSLTSFYYLTRSILVKSETHFDKYDLAFQKYFEGIETPNQISEQIIKWLENALPPKDMEIDLEAKLKYQLENLDLDELKKMFEERLKEQKSEHHGGSKWVGTGGTSPFGHSGYHPGGIRVGGNSLRRSAVKVAGERKYQEFRGDETLGVRQFEVALKKLRQFTTRLEGPKDQLDLDKTISATCKNAGRLELVWTRPSKNAVKIILLMDSGGSMGPYYRLCNQLFTAVNKSAHFKALDVFYFHNCVYDHIYLDPSCRLKNSIKTEDLLRTHNSDYKLIFVGDASMAPSELIQVNGIIDWGMTNSEPGLTWLERLARHFSHNAWLNPIPESHWNTTEGYYTIQLIKSVFPMFELTVDGLEQAIKKLKVRTAI
ncbi:MAG: VWA domain-containing protein [Clostridia bacterium]|nr:VWA domain-containing protein [Clostridia bacterium]